MPEIRARNWQTRKLGERLAVNTIIQGTAADIIKVAMVRSHDALAAAGLATRVILQIHDELLFEGPEDEAERAAEIVVARRWSARPSSTRRSPSTPASGRTGSPRSEWPLRRTAATVTRHATSRRRSAALGRTVGGLRFAVS